MWNYNFNTQPLRKISVNLQFYLTTTTSVRDIKQVIFTQFTAHTIPGGSGGKQSVQSHLGAKFCHKNDLGCSTTTKETGPMERFTQFY